ncbi:MAG: CHAD domain-containing protein [Rhodospirillaceae bacterium]
MAEPGAAADAPQNEVELKLLTDARTARRVWRQPAVKALLSGKPRVRRIRTAYYDTPDDALMQYGCALRVRSCGEKHEQHLKTAGRVEGGLFHRQEWQAPLASDTPDLAAWDGEAAEILAPHRKALRRIFESDMERTDALLSNGLFSVELAVDIGVIRAFDEEGATVAETPLVEIELEWKGGPAEHVFDLALDLARALPLVLGWQSKAERGYTLSHGGGPQPRRAALPAIPADTPLPRAMAQILSETMAHFLTNQPSLEASGAAEAVHQMRIACRRMRAALALFADLLPEAELAEFRAGFRDLALVLGHVRDLDVLIAEGLAPLNAAAETPEEVALTLRRLLPLLESRRAELLAAARGRIAAPETALLLLRLGRRLVLSAQESRGEALASFADAVLGRRHHAVKRRAKRLCAQSAPQRHALRIAAKKLRYASEFFQSLYPPKAMRLYLRNLSALQDILGSLNDIANLPHLIAETAGKDAATATAAGYAMGWHLRRLRFGLEEASEVCRALDAAPLFRRR